MPLPHRTLVREIAQLGSVRDVASFSKDAQVAYNRSISALAAFRSRHISLACQYILSQRDGGDSKGTGGTSFVKFLKQARDETAALCFRD
jgi:indoleamine 2,3-dioxygenase